MGSGYVHEVDVAHIEERGHNIQLWEHLQQVLFLTPDCIAETIKRLLAQKLRISLIDTA
jgi:NADP-dependent 3-hydroxy acid dehydrogenase YdfG